ncbi:ankyrin repeat domain-containing protein [Polaromonas sp.]|uniref:ankyrin repeat domain-containing protein n=1 Tax=Polaromonas sp. TaxID=1869339 RepID=UPI003267C977
MTEPEHSPHSDELLQRYREASADDTRRPGTHVRDAVRAHAQMVIEAGKAKETGTAETTQTRTKAPAANQSRWKISALASLALAGLTGLLVLQFDRGNDEEKDLVFGQPSVSAPPSASSTPSSAPSSAPSSTSSPAPPAPSTGSTPAAAPASPAPGLPQSPRQADKARAEAAESAAGQTSKAPATPAAEKPVPSPAVTRQAAAKTEAETKKIQGGVAPSVVASPPAAAPPPPAAPTAPAITQDMAKSTNRARMADAATGSLSAPSAGIAAAPPAPAAAPAPAPAAPAAYGMAPPQKQGSAVSELRASRAEANAGPNRLAGALLNAARTGNLAQLERLLQQGAPVSAADAAGRTPLILAVMQGHTAVVKRLLAAGANPALVDQEGLNALQHARRLGLDDIAHLIEAAP